MQSSTNQVIERDSFSTPTDTGLPPIQRQPRRFQKPDAQLTKDQIAQKMINKQERRQKTVERKVSKAIDKALKIQLVKEKKPTTMGETPSGEEFQKTLMKYMGDHSFLPKI